MKRIYKDYLFSKRMFVCDGEISKTPNETLFALAHLFAIRIIKGQELIFDESISYAEAMLGVNVPEPFYRGFPESVRRLPAYVRLLDQLLHYETTYGEGDFSAPGHSLFEADEDLLRTAFREDAQIRDFSVVSEAEAEKILRGIVEDLLAGSRPLSAAEYAIVREFLADHDFRPEKVASKNTCVRLLLDTRDMDLVRFLYLSDVIRLTQEMNYRLYDGATDIRQLNLKNRDRKFLTAVMDALLGTDRMDLRTCYEKKQLWNGLLHHLHYKPKNENGKAFVDAMRGNENKSVYSAFEGKLARGDIRGAVDALKEGKGSGAVLRNLDYLISRCSDPETAEYVLRGIDTPNAILLMQLLLRYDAGNLSGGPRTFRFTRFEQMVVHTEEPEEVRRRRSQISRGQAGMLSEHIRRSLKDTLAGRLGRVYIDPNMKRYGVPLQETASMSGFGVLPRGSRLPIGEGKVLRGFTYWEKVDDIDLSCFLLKENGEQLEFSWRTTGFSKADEIVYSGDQTSGFSGGSEYFDIDLQKVTGKYPGFRYVVFCDNVFSRMQFSQCVCRAGYMLRDAMSSGEVYEPKTVQSAFTVNCAGTFAYLFGIDLKTREFVWLNVARESGAHVAGETEMAFLLKDLRTTQVLNQYDLFEMMATEIVQSPEEAQVAVADRPLEVSEGTEIIREYDTARMRALMEA